MNFARPKPTSRNPHPSSTLTRPPKRTRMESNHRSSPQMKHDKYSLRVQFFGNPFRTIIVTVQVITPVGGIPSCHVHQCASFFFVCPGFPSSHQQVMRNGLLYLPTAVISPNRARISYAAMRLLFLPLAWGGGPLSWSHQVPCDCKHIIIDFIHWNLELIVPPPPHL